MGTPGVADLFVARMLKEVRMNNKYAMLVKREFWEHRSLWIAPLVAAGFFVVVAICAVLFASQPHQRHWASALRAHARRSGRARNPVLLAWPRWPSQIFLVLAITCFVYLLDCLYSRAQGPQHPVLEVAAGVRDRGHGAGEIRGWHGHRADCRVHP